MLAHSSQERSGLCEKPAETKQIAKKFLQAGSRADFLGTLRCGMEKSMHQPRPLCSEQYSGIWNLHFGNPVMNRSQ
jgi:hypothetical protein